MFYVGCHRLTTTLLLYLDLGLAVNGALAELTKGRRKKRKRKKN